MHRNEAKGNLFALSTKATRGAEAEGQIGDATKEVSPMISEEHNIKR